MRKGPVVLLVLCLAGFCVSHGAFAEVRGQSRQLFWMDVPQEWLWYEDQDSVTVTSPFGGQVIRIGFAIADGVRTEADEKDIVQRNMASRIQDVTSRNGKTVTQRERKIDGVYALQSGFLLSLPEGMRQATAIVFFRDRRLFDVYFEASREFQRLDMEKIVDTIKFEPPKEEEEEAVKEAAAPAATAQEVVFQDLNQKSGKDSLFCINVLEGEDLKEGFVINTQEEYRALVEKYRSSHPVCQDYLVPALDLSQNTLLGKSVDGRGCLINWKREVFKDDAEKVYTYVITVEQRGDCPTQGVNMNWILIPKVRADYQVVFEVKSEKDI